jgi:hypothetical protein
MRRASRNLFFLLFFLLCFSGWSFLPLAGSSADKLYWNGERKLRWDDFMGTPDSVSSEPASVSAHLLGNIKVETDTVEIYCFSYLLKANPG